MQPEHKVQVHTISIVPAAGAQPNSFNVVAPPSKKDLSILRKAQRFCAILSWIVMWSGYLVCAIAKLMSARAQAHFCELAATGCVQPPDGTLLILAQLAIAFLLLLALTAAMWGNVFLRWRCCRGSTGTFMVIPALAVFGGVIAVLILYISSVTCNMSSSSSGSLVPEYLKNACTDIERMNRVLYAGAAVCGAGMGVWLITCCVWAVDDYEEVKPEEEEVEDEDDENPGGLAGGDAQPKPSPQPQDQQTPNAMGLSPAAVGSVLAANNLMGDTTSTFINAIATGQLPVHNVQMVTLSPAPPQPPTSAEENSPSVPSPSPAAAGAANAPVISPPVVVTPLSPTVPLTHATSQSLDLQKRQHMMFVQSRPGGDEPGQPTLPGQSEPHESGLLQPVPKHAHLSLKALDMEQTNNAAPNVPAQLQQPGAAAAAAGARPVGLSSSSQQPAPAISPIAAGSPSSEVESPDSELDELAAGAVTFTADSAKPADAKTGASEPGSAAAPSAPAASSGAPPAASGLPGAVASPSPRNAK